MATLAEIESRLDKAMAAEDLDEIRRIQKEFVETSDAPRPFEPAIALSGQTPAQAVQEGDKLVAVFNGAERLARDIIYRRRRRAGYAGPIVVDEGDSWYQYPVFLDDIIDQLSDPYAIKSLSAAGDTLGNMLAEGEYAAAIADEGADFFLFSAAGNDVVGGGNLSQFLNAYETGMEVADIVKRVAVNEMLQSVRDGYVRVVRTALAAKPDVHVMFHGYDHALPRPNGRWLGTPMEDLGIPRVLWPAVVAILIDDLNEVLKDIEAEFRGSATHIDCRGTVGSSVRSWYDELHPRNPGYARAASLFKARIDTLWRERGRGGRVVAGFESVRPAPPSDVRDEMFALFDRDPRIGADAAEEAILSRDADTAPDYRRERRRVTSKPLSTRDQEILRDYQELLKESPEENLSRKKTRRRLVPESDETAFERILGKSNLFPVNFLSRGATIAKAVAKVQLYRNGIPWDSGTGFLVAPGLLLTNNHVIDAPEAAARAKVILDYAQDDQFDYLPPKRFDVTPDIFFTSDRNALDFTFVSVRPFNEAGDDLGAFGHFTLVEESGKALKGEYVSIIQHPGGRYKAIALRDSRVIGPKGDFIYYSTDTEPGSSGSPVVNDQWLPLALHHRSVPDPEIENKWIANRGVRISRIIDTLKAAARGGDPMARRILQAVDLAAETDAPAPVSPLMPLRPGEATVLAQPAAPASSNVEEAAFPSDRWAGVDGYDPGFLTAEVPLPLPADRSVINHVDGRPDLPYLHFSVVMHKTRKLLIVSACNVDGTRLKPLARSDGWRTDPRISLDMQVDNRAYGHNEYDRGHMVRRLSPMWGTADEARFAEADTFHYTNAVPQHARLNQKAWVELETYLLEWAEANGARMSIFTGPLLRPDDPVYRGIVQVPSDYWKVAIAETAAGLRAVGYLHTQKHLIPTVEEAFGDYKTHRVPIHVLAELSGLNMDALVAHDVSSEPFESARVVRIVEGPSDIGFV